MWHLSCIYEVSNYFSFEFPLVAIANNGTFQKKFKKILLSHLEKLPSQLNFMITL